MIKNQWSQKGKTGINVHENMHNPPSHQQASRHFCKILKVVVKTELDIWSTDFTISGYSSTTHHYQAYRACFLENEKYGPIFGKIQGDFSLYKE